MIFCAKNEIGVSSWQLVISGDKIVSRRLKPIEIGKIVAVQPGRGKKAVSHIKIVDCIAHMKWYDETMMALIFLDILQDEAKREGFQSWDGLLEFFYKKKIDINKTYRLEFELVKK